MSPVPPPRKRSGGRIALLVVGIVAAVVVVCGGGLAALYYAGKNLASGSTTPGATAGTSGAVIFHDSMTDPTTNWSNDPGKCFYGSDGYHIADSYLCYAPAGVQTDADVSVQVKQVSGDTTTPYGITFRVTRKVSHYDFLITGDSHWLLAKCDTNGSTCTNLIDFTSNAAIKGGLNTSNTLEVRAVGSHFEFFVNSINVGHLDDASLSSGLVGLVGSNGIECVFTNFNIARPS
jgi:hypothetical protein